MPNPNPNPNPSNKDGKDGAQTDPWEKLKGQKDENGVPKHPEEKAEFYKKKSDSSNVEAQKIIDDNKSLTEENERLKTPPAPPAPGNVLYTANDLSSKIPDWNTLSPAQQTAILNSYGSLHKDITSIKLEVAKMVDKQDFDRGYNALVLDSQFASLGKFKEEFIAKSYEKENLKTPLRTLAVAFLAEKGEWGKRETPSEDAPAGDAGRSGLDGGTGGDQAPPQDTDTYTSKEAQELRSSDPKKYMRLVREKKLTIKD